MSPELSWEKCDNMRQPKGLTPFVVFIEGWKKIDIDTFLVYYQGCDSYTGVGKITVNF
jgi:predicted GH43/DUF377 family glycosyl hydrolase